MKYSKVLLLIILLLGYSTCLYSAIVVQGNDTTAPKGFKTKVNAQTYDILRGDFFVGLESGTDKFTISRAARPTFRVVPKFTGILRGDSSANPLIEATIEFLTLSAQDETLSVLAAVKQEMEVFTATTVFGLFTDGTQQQVTAALQDASGSSDTGGIINIAASSSHIFAALKPNNDNWGEPNSGIALICVNPSSKPCVTASTTTLELQVKDATTGLDGNRAVELQKSSTVLKGNMGGNDVIITNTSAPMHFDKKLDRLYIGVQLQTGGDVNDIGKSVVAARVDTTANNALVLDPIAPDSAITGAPVDEIIVTQGANINLTVKQLRTMCASTGPSYLIVSGGTGALSEVGNRVFALPLVNDPTNFTINGTLAKKDSALSSDFVFTVPATMPGDLPINNAVSDPAAVVGAGLLPVAPNDCISDMVVVGDTVYVSVAEAPSNFNSTGTFYSQALFAQDGKVLRWTPWTKYATPANAFPCVTLPCNATHNGSVKFFEVDAKTGNIWIVEGTTERVVGISSWNTGLCANRLTCRINNALPCGAFAVLDLDQATRGFLQCTAHRYALFGGTEKVVFARASEAFDRDNLSSPQTIVTDFLSEENFLETALPNDAGCSQVLEYSRTSTCAGDPNNLNYFFAGTEKGLFVFTDAGGNGFNALDLNTLNNPPFSTRTWQKISTISGSVIDIKTSGAGNLYILTFESTCEEPLKSVLYSIPFASTTAAMFAPGNIRTIAQTNTGVFAGILQFYGIQIIATGQPDSANPEDKEQLILATNQGLFRSNANQMAANNGIQDALNQAAANWQLIPTTEKTLFFCIGGIDTPVRHTVWPFSLVDEATCKSFERSIIHQLSGNGNADGSAPLFNLINPFIPQDFNARPLLCPFVTLDPITHFFSDGTRRFFIFNRTQDKATQTKLAVIPFDVCDWNVTQVKPIDHPVLNTIERFFWVKQIGATGLLMAGTENGVVTLE